MSAPVPPAGDAQGAGASRATLDALAGVCERAAAGDLEARVVGAGGGDPGIARLARAINAMLDTADAFVREASAAMENGAQDRFHRPILLRGLRGAYRQSAVVINAAAVKMRERRDEIGFVERLAGQNVESVADVARACGELAESSSEIARRAAGAAATTRESVSQAGRAAEAVAAMNDVVRTIDGFVGLIQRVAKQTNLLALNATIEAARAGAAGKGFAVVAAEVKDLSKSTADATGDIRQQVQKIQETAREVGRLIEVINASVLEVDASAAFISRAVEQQVRATSDITRSIDVVSHNTEQVSARIRGAQAAGPAAGGRARR